MGLITLSRSRCRPWSGTSTHGNQWEEQHNQRFMSRFAALFRLFAVTILSVVGSAVVRADESEARRLLTEVILYDGERQDVAVEALGEEGAEIIKVVVEAWRVGEVSTTTRAESEELALLKTP